jgi:predicted glycosyltransferase
MKSRAEQQNLSFKALGWKIPAGSKEEEILLNLSDEEFATEVLKAEKIVCSAGYSTLCDLVALGKRADVFPTKGQTEQAYLAKRFS